MFLFLLFATLFAGSGGEAQLPLENCDTHELSQCEDLVPKTPIGLPKYKKELDAHCLAYHTGMSCMDAWMEKCLPTNGQRVIMKQIGGARALMRFLCDNDTALRKEFLKESSCWSKVSPDWLRCTNQLKRAIQEVTDQSQHLVYFNKNAELCCVREAYMSCMSYAGRGCSANASSLLRRMARVLAQDVAACSHSRLHCSASSMSTSTILTFICILLYNIENLFNIYLLN